MFERQRRVFRARSNGRPFTYCQQRAQHPAGADDLRLGMSTLTRWKQDQRPLFNTGLQQVLRPGSGALLLPQGQLQSERYEPMPQQCVE